MNIQNLFNFFSLFPVMKPHVTMKNIYFFPFIKLHLVPQKDSPNPGI